MSADVLHPLAVALEAPAIPASTLRLGPEGWIGRMTVEREIADLVVLRPPGSNDREAPLAARQRLSHLAAGMSSIKQIAVTCLLDARSSIPSTPSFQRWRAVELRIDREGRAWVGLYESGEGLHETWMVELDDVNLPCSLWRRQKRDPHNLSDCGEKLR